mgnify:CR=1 FL=1|jgi:hypothetical protein
MCLGLGSSLSLAVQVSFYWFRFRGLRVSV